MAYQRRALPSGGRFPIEKSNDYLGTITFRPVIYNPPEVSGRAFADLFTREGDGLLTQLLNADEGSLASSFIEGRRAASSASNGSTYDEVGIAGTPSLNRTPLNTDTVVSSSTTTVVRDKGVVLYLPNAIQVNDTVSYDNFDLGAIGAIGAAGMRAGQGALNSLAQGTGQAYGSLVDLVSGNVAEQRGARLAAARLADQGRGVTGGVVRSALATTVNPNTILLFKNVQLREFQFQFKLIANSAREADEIDNIIKFFRTLMYPETINFDTEAGGLNVPIGYEFPNKFEITMRYNNQQVGVKILHSVLRTFQSVYNPTSMSWHRDGKPSEVDITLGFGEERTLNRQDIEQGY